MENMQEEKNGGMELVEYKLTELVRGLTDLEGRFDELQKGFSQTSNLNTQIEGIKEEIVSLKKYVPKIEEIRNEIDLSLSKDIKDLKNFKDKFIEIASISQFKKKMEQLQDLIDKKNILLGIVVAIQVVGWIAMYLIKFSPK